MLAGGEEPAGPLAMGRSFDAHRDSCSLGNPRKGVVKGALCCGRRAR